MINGDEIRSQKGNNNVCQDNQLAWMDGTSPHQLGLVDFLRFLIQLR